MTGVSTVIGQVTGLVSVGWLGLALRFGRGRIAFAILGAALLVLVLQLRGWHSRRERRKLGHVADQGRRIRLLLRLSLRDQMR